MTLTFDESEGFEHVYFLKKLYQYTFWVCFHSSFYVRKGTFTDEFIIGKQKKQTFHTFFDRIGSMNE
ncbi:hypothetical protein AMR95_06455 [Bacillus sp. G1(2015b)]|nr:hypothetical protein AMR95_06455 [Bacillus sp. G1(2015b)]